MKYRVMTEEVRPGWDEFGKAVVRDVVVEARSAEEAMEMVDEMSDKYTRPYMAVLCKD